MECKKGLASLIFGIGLFGCGEAPIIKSPQDEGMVLEYERVVRNNLKFLPRPLTGKEDYFNTPWGCIRIRDTNENNFLGEESYFPDFRIWLPEADRGDTVDTVDQYLCDNKYSLKPSL